MANLETLCWSCKNATGYCSWSDGTFTPVDGWKATKGKYSFVVHECPRFKKDRMYLTQKQIGKIINKSVGTVQSWGVKKVLHKLLEVGVRAGYCKEERRYYEIC